MQIHPDAIETLALLDSLSIPYRYYHHDLARTMAECADIGADVGARHFKNLFLTNRSRSVFVLLLLCPEKEFRSGVISKQLGTGRLSFATAEDMMAHLGLVPGSVTPMALARECAKGVRLAIDRDILAMENVCAHPCTTEASVALSKDDLFRFLSHCGCPISCVDA